ncbi:MAG: pyridoxamine 5'-phosphate oxidase [Gammaproteobacteria bacterium]|nr:pyridoxamine 5'-phosphate oxidase [Gammaproteobacteria bacterium]MBV9724210.1 pyridoxamine 5'-phosphate oxidase [Gammaproteobacteria bacterium]
MVPLAAMADHTELLPDSLPAEPLTLVGEWLAQARAANIQPNPNAMVLATSTREGRPSARVVLCKDIVPQPGYVVFYTNYLSAKGRQLKDNPRAAAVMHWDALHRQVRIEGAVVLAPDSDSDAYFATRAWQSRIGAWASEQSEPIASRARLLDAVTETARRFGAPTPGSPGADDSLKVTIPRPPHWGGFRLWVDAVELWVEGAARIHDRARWQRTLRPLARGAFKPEAWVATRLQP